MRTAVICEPVRTPIGRYGGMFASLTAVELGVTALKGLLDRTGVTPEAVEDVILGHCYPSSEAPAIGRVVALDAGLPVTVPGMQLDRRCGSGLQAVIQACMQVGTGQNDLVVAGGAESMSNVVFYSTDMRWGGARTRREDPRRTGPRPYHRGRPRLPGARRHAGDRREPAPRVPHPARRAGRTGGHLAPAGRGRAEGRHLRRGDHPGDGARPQGRPRQRHVVDTDEHPRADTTVESLAKLKPVLGKQDPDATVTAGNASGQNDAASMCIVTTPEKAAELGLTPLVKLVSWGVAGVAPNIMGIGPVPGHRGRAGARPDSRSRTST